MRDLHTPSIRAKSESMKIESNTFTVAVSGTFTISRADLESLLKGVMPQERDAEPRNTQPKIDVAQPKPAAKD